MYMKTVNYFHELIIETKTIQESKSATLIKKHFSFSQISKVSFQNNYQF